MKKIITIETAGRRDLFWCGENCDNCPLRFKCYTTSKDTDLEAYTFSMEEMVKLVRGGFKLGEDIG